MDGTAVNQGISTTMCMGQTMDIMYPTVDFLCRRAYELGEEAVG